MVHTGGCLCGEVRYSSAIDPLDVGYCHCHMCQKLSGATCLPWASFATNGFTYTSASPKIYRSSAHGQREFCANCGAQIAFRLIDGNGTVEINVGTLDDPADLEPRYHIWCDSRVPWFDTADDLPRYPKSGPLPGEAGS